MNSRNINLRSSFQQSPRNAVHQIGSVHQVEKPRPIALSSEIAMGFLITGSTGYDGLRRGGGGPLIRALYRDEMIQPLDTLPTDWDDGQALQIIEGESSDDPEEIERWWKELTELVNRPHDPEDWGRLEAAWADADRRAKDQMRKEIGLE